MRAVLSTPFFQIVTSALSQTPDLKKQFSSGKIPRHLLHVISLIFALAAHGQEKQALPTTIATGTEWETSVYYLDSGKEGPTVLITSGIHGNESAGAFAADQIRHWPVTQGKLIVIPRVNQQALDAGERRIPNSAPEISDLNRNFPKTGEPNEARTELAKIVWAFVKSQKPDWVIDLHEGFAINRQNPKSVGSSILCSPNEATLPIFEHALAVVNASIDNPDDLFVLKSDTMTANGSLVRASMERLGAVGAILETTYKGVPLAVRIRQHRLMVHRILRNLKMIENAPSDLVFKKPEDKLKYIAIYQDGGVGGNGSREIRERLESEPEKYTTRIVSGADIREGTLDDFDAVIFPGGSGRKESASLQQEGLENVREFISDGGVYVGVCAGCYLACENFSWSLKILDAKTLPGKWKRGRASLDLEFSDVLPFSEMGLKSNKAKVTYINGPVMAPANSGAIPDFETVAIFKTETAKNGSPKGIQINSPAILRGQFGKGRVIGISPHPEQSDGLRDVLPRLLEWGLEN